MGRKEMADELRELRKTAGSKSVSKMKMFEISAEIERLKHHTATTPHSASYTPNKSTPKVEPKVKNVKEAREAEFPVAGGATATKSEKVKGKKAVAKAVPEAKAPSKMSKKTLKQMVEELSDSE